ncbi:hypothetical protein Taro_027713 [Colocasia esculenta]|uniref:Uncharacterized protein n=1 Tax=Colocasia esculenta TaxID=4460 RepID=A0A843VEL4_COLES|nr:hypothetical protein [Colocasia esculenta]
MRGAMRCISCILPCGALDVVRVVHANGRVEEISHEVQAWEIMQAHPKHVLRELPAASEVAEGRRGPIVLPPTAELRRGRIYFLVPLSAPKEKAHQVPAAAAAAAAAKRSAKKPKKPQGEGRGGEHDTARLLASERYLSEIMSEKASTHRDRRRGRVGVWRPHLASISEVSSTDF